MPADIGQHHVEEHEIERLGANQLERGPPAFGLDHLEARQAEVDAAEQPDRRLVVDDQHAPRTGLATPGVACASRPALRRSLRICRHDGSSLR